MTKISFSAATAVTLDATPGSKFTELTTITTSANVHHVFNCPVECKNGTTPAIPATASNYVNFKGGLTAFSLSNARSQYWCGNISMTNTTTWSVSWNNDASTSQVLAGNGSLFSAKQVGLGYFYVNSAENVANTAKVEKIVYENGMRYVNYGGNWACRWQCVAALMRSGSVLKVGELAIAGDVPEIFHSYAESSYGESGIIEANKITLGNTKDTGSAWENQRRPYLWLCRGRRYGNWSNNKMTLHNEYKSGTWAIGSGGLTFSSSCDNNARYKVASGGAVLNSFADWTLASHSKGAAKVALEFEGGGTLTIDTGHYAVGDPAIDDGATAHTVTVNGVIGGSGSLLVKGGGKVVFKSECTHSNWTKVTSGEAVLKAGSRPGNSSFSVWSGAAASFPDSGTVTLGTNIVLGANSTLKFTIHDNTDTNKLNTAAVTLNNLDTDDKFVNVYVDAPEGQFLRGFTPYTLITVTGTKLTAEDLSKYKLQDKPTWASRLDVVGGNLVLWPSEPGLSLSVR